MTKLKSLFNFNSEDLGIIAILATIFTTWISTGDVVAGEWATIFAMMFAGGIVAIHIFFKNIFNIKLKLSFNIITVPVFVIICTLYTGMLVSPQCHADSPQSLEPYQAPAVEMNHHEATVNAQNIHYYNYKDVNGYIYHYEITQPMYDTNVIITLQFDPQNPKYTQDLYILPLNQYTATQLTNAPQYVPEILQEYQYTKTLIDSID